MAGEIRVTMGISSTNFVRPVAWTEVYWHRNPDIGIAASVGEADRLAIRRAQLLGDGLIIDLIRCSAEGIYRDSLCSDRTFTRSNSGKLKTATQSDYAQQGQKIRMESTSKNRRFMTLSGLPDGLQYTDEVVSDPDWLKAFGLWKGELIKNWGWFGLVKNDITNKAPPRVLNPNPPPKYTPRPMKIFPFTDIILQGPSNHKRGRPFNLYRGRSKVKA